MARASKTVGGVGAVDQGLLGEPLLEFVDHRRDPTTGEAVLSSRWVLPERCSSEEGSLVTERAGDGGKVVLTVRFAGAQAL